MPVPRFFWFSASAALLLVAASVAYFFLAVMPAVERHRDERASELARKQASDKQIADCAEQARRAGEDYGKYLSRLGPPSTVTGVSNHYNHKLGKCLADVETMDKNGVTETIMDAYEQSNVLWCSTVVHQTSQRVCMDAKNGRIEPTDAEKQMDSLMRE